MVSAKVTRLNEGIKFALLATNMYNVYRKRKINKALQTITNTLALKVVENAV